MGLNEQAEANSGLKSQRGVSASRAISTASKCSLSAFHFIWVVVVSGNVPKFRSLCCVFIILRPMKRLPWGLSLARLNSTKPPCQAQPRADSARP